MTAPFSQMSGGIGQLRSSAVQRQRLRQGRMAVGSKRSATLRTRRLKPNTSNSCQYIHGISHDFGSIWFTYRTVARTTSTAGTTPFRTSTKHRLAKQTLSQAHRTHQQLSPSISLRMVAVFRPVPPVRFHIQQESDIPASTQLYNQICFAIAARHCPPGHRLPSTCQLATVNGTAPKHDQQKVYRQLETDGVVEAMAGSGIYVRDQQNPGKSKRHRTSAIGASPISTGRCESAWMAC